MLTQPLGERGAVGVARVEWGFLRERVEARLRDLRAVAVQLQQRTQAAHFGELVVGAAGFRRQPHQHGRGAFDALEQRLGVVEAAGVQVGVDQAEVQAVGHRQVDDRLLEQRHGIGRAALLRQRAGGGAERVGRQRGAVGTQAVVQRDGVGGTAALQQRHHAVGLQPHA
ncbi:hypothetical protein D9M68_820590 [compost metagenome]